MASGPSPWAPGIRDGFRSPVYPLSSTLEGSSAMKGSMYIAFLSMSDIRALFSSTSMKTSPPLNRGDCMKLSLIHI
eukprot:5198737-Alexandrium_andersonii.AAC.1